MIIYVILYRWLIWKSRWSYAKWKQDADGPPKVNMKETYKNENDIPVESNDPTEAANSLEY